MMKRWYWGIGLLGLVIITGIVGCQTFKGEHHNPTMPTDDATGNFIIGDADISEWGAEYSAGHTYFMINVPYAVVMKVEYGIVGGGVFAIFAETKHATKLEIGLATRDLLEHGNSQVDTLMWACVTYVQGGTFTTIPVNAITSFQGKDKIHYQREDEATGDKYAWWPIETDFGWSSPSQRQCVIENSEVVNGITPVSGPFPKPLPQQGTWVLAASGATCDTACGDQGLTCDLATTTTAYNDQALCDRLMTKWGLLPELGDGADGPYSGTGTGCAAWMSNPPDPSGGWDWQRHGPVICDSSENFSRRACYCQ
ncbi:hypothetical protein U14_00392 [Candidatus Moduliflexus flocculans]|uniref:Uncharacterized protein n=1 Tax=Candidatus Moduliflexus flocculans TaxID=1499966 RepID=A0A0S6VVR2_9BACT|nr:hypothetical protein U14_00392 [Candidatus Moduliflexus flocculans]